MTNNELDRFLAKVSLLPKGCWEWTASLDSGGYGRLYISKSQRSVLAHRLSYEHFVCDIPEGLEIDHLCRNRACVNPTHLEAVTRSENIRRGLKQFQFWQQSQDKARRTHCDEGHALQGNTWWRFRDGEWFRNCKTCMGKSHKRYRLRTLGREGDTLDRRHLHTLVCPRGHVYTNTNTYWRVRSNGSLYHRCKRCHNDRILASQRKARAA